MERFNLGDRMSIFKAYDIRGIYPTELNEDTIYKIGRAFVKFLNCKNVVVARDARHSSPSLHKALVKGITDQGADVVDIGLSSIAMFYFSIANYKLDSGLMVTASHNPKQYNGLKLCREKAIAISEETGIREIEALVNTDFKKEKKGKVTKKNVLKDYIDYVLKFSKKSNLKIVFDFSNAMVALAGTKIFKKICNAVYLNEKIDGTFPGHEANPVKEENLVQLKNKVKQEKADFGICFDGDGDRVGLVDENGQTVANDMLTILISKSFLKNNPGEKIVYDLRFSRAVKEEVLASNGKPVFTRVGHSFIKEKMRKEKAIFAGEFSGHFFFRENFFTDSAIIAALKTINLIEEAKKPLSELIKPFKKYWQTGEINFEVEDKDAKIRQVEALFKDGKISRLDGVTVEYQDWWFNLRKSNTEPVIRLTLEAGTKQKMQEMKNKITKLIQK